MFEDMLPDFDVRDKRVLDIGCGMGGRTTWLARNGAREVVGIDINEKEIRDAERLRREFHPDVQNVSFHVSKENEVQPSLGSFDYVLLIDSLEHVVSPFKAIQLAAKYVRPQGKIYFTTIGWFHHAGSHTGVPFANLFFSDETILNVIRRTVSRPDYQPMIWDSEPPIARWEGIYNLRDRPGEYLNKVTIREMKKLVKHAPFRNGRVIPIGFKNRKLRWLNPLRHIPLLNEVFHSAVVGVLES
jgi:SAM-dependent methyltransferase